jgi:hypothetical protein
MGGGVSRSIFLDHSGGGLSRSNVRLTVIGIGAFG